MASLTLLTLFHTISVRDIHDYEFLWNKELLFEVTLIVTLLIIAVLSIVAAVFGCVFLPTYNVQGKKKEEKFNRKNWSNS